jgi:hypothetical protein
LRITLDRLHTKRRQLHLVPANHLQHLFGAHPVASLSTPTLTGYDDSSA